MYVHPLIQSELARQRRLDLYDTEARARSTAAGWRARSRGEASELSELVPAARNGDAYAWEVLVARFTPTIRAVVRGYRLNPADVEDVVQATWVTAFAHIGRIRQPEAIGGWLTVTARREALRTLQARQRETLIDEPSHHHRSGHSRRTRLGLPAGRRQIARPRLSAGDRLLLAVISRVLPRRSWRVFFVSRRRCCAGTASTAGCTAGTLVDRLGKERGAGHSGLLTSSRGASAWGSAAARSAAYRSSYSRPRCTSSRSSSAERSAYSWPRSSSLRWRSRPRLYWK
jgi:Sigma-70 region 2